MGLDETDIRILDQLNRDGRASLREIAATLDLSPSTVSNRFHALQERDVITGFRPVIDYEEAGFGLTAVLEVSADPKAMERVAARLQERERVRSFFEVTGDADMVLICAFLDREDMNRFVKSVQKEDGVIATKTNVVLTVPQDRTIPLSPVLD